MLTGQRHGTKVGDRHAMRLAVLSLTGCRPAELKKGITLRLTDSGKHVTAEIAGAKVNNTRGQETRVIRIPVSGSCATALAGTIRAQGGRWKMETTDADYRSLNRALKASGLSCYSFRHQVASELKEAVSTGAMQATEAAAAMGHRSTASLSYYGTRSRSHGGRALCANGTDNVRIVPVDYAARAVARAARKAENGDAFRFPPRARPMAAPKAATSHKPKSIRPTPR